MGFVKWGYNFEGAFTSCQSLEELPGVYVIWCKFLENWNVLDVGESDDVRRRVCNHDREDCWKRNCSGTIYFSAMYLPGYTEDERRRIESYIRSQTNPPCGDR